MRVTDGGAEPKVQFAAVEDDLPALDLFHRGQRHGEVAGVLDINDELRPSLRRHLADGAESLVAIMDEDVAYKARIFTYDIMTMFGFPGDALPPA